VVLFDRPFWAPLLAWIRDQALPQQMVSPEDLELLTVTDDPDEAVRCVLDCYDRRCAEVPQAPRKGDAQ
jgi:predicted Rossmann-fold nucleotide-binding protein